MAMTCLPPSRVVTSWYGARFWIMPCETKTSAKTKLSGSRT